MKSLKIIFIIFNLILGGMMIYGGMKKFEKPSPSPTEIVEKVKAGQEVAPSVEILKIKNYIFGMKQTGYFWQFLGIVELLVGLLLISQRFSLLGAIMALPVTIHIFLFHLFLEPHEIGELIQMTFLLIINLLIIAKGYKHWKGILSDKSLLKLS
ncbi:DoxX family membrane protein [Flavobacterium macrobrachii]|uniref:DoxX family membrane protein n=1 Tax=Flavobacterium macrobrachii TaxID=591204 RepID=A0ABS2CVY4_9FLAO|nr:DoxX family membrane protein [Flavobacterium macrobrachii]MBM6499095.1 DoxX family membrane protein [Flavobacterium macrobrachii]